MVRRNSSTTTLSGSTETSPRSFILASWTLRITDTQAPTITIGTKAWARVSESEGATAPARGRVAVGTLRTRRTRAASDVISRARLPVAPVPPARFPAYHWPDDYLTCRQRGYRCLARAAPASAAPARLARRTDRAPDGG